jgi:hypothetical protein
MQVVKRGCKYEDISARDYSSSQHKSTCLCFVHQFTYNLRWVPCHHGMSHPRVLDEGDGFLLRKVAANKLNKEPWQTTRTRSGSPAWGVGHRSNNLSL